MYTKRTIFTGLFVIVCLCMAGFTGGASPEDEASAIEVKDIKVPKDASGYPVIGHLKKKGRIITIKKGPDGPLYTVETKDGKILAVNLSSDKLYAEFPELKSVIENGLAVDDAAYRPTK